MKKRNILLLGIIGVGITSLGFLFYEIKKNNRKKYIKSSKKRTLEEIEELKENIEKSLVETNEQNNDSEVVYSSFFSCNIKKEYAFAVSKFIDYNDSKIFKYVTKFVFDEHGEFNYDILKQLLTEYEQTRLQNIKDLDKRKKEIFSKNPRLEAIEKELNILSISIAKSALLKTTSTENLTKKIEELKKERKFLLQQMGKDLWKSTCI